MGSGAHIVAEGVGAVRLRLEEGEVDHVLVEVARP